MTSSRGAIKSFLISERYVETTCTDVTTSFYTLSDEAQWIVTNGSQEIIVLHTAENQKLSLIDLQTAVGNKDVAKIVNVNCMESRKMVMTW